MKASILERVSLTSALTLVFTMGSANAAAYSWTEIHSKRRSHGRSLWTE
jgi:hypothetical protein